MAPTTAVKPSTTTTSSSSSSNNAVCKKKQAVTPANPSAMREQRARARRVSKGQIERKRRARINRNLNDMKNFLTQDAASHVFSDTNLTPSAKLDKADVLELSVKFMRSALVAKKSSHCSAGTANDDDDEQTRFLNGFLACAMQIISMLDTDSEHFHEQTAQQIRTHVVKCVENARKEQQTPQQQKEEAQQSSSASPSPITNCDDDNNGMMSPAASVANKINHNNSPAPSYVSNSSSTSSSSSSCSSTLSMELPAKSVVHTEETVQNASFIPPPPPPQQQIELTLQDLITLQQQQSILIDPSTQQLYLNPSSCNMTLTDFTALTTPTTTEQQQQPACVVDWQTALLLLVAQQQQDPNQQQQQQAAAYFMLQQQQLQQQNEEPWRPW